MKILFMGTPDFAASSLAGLIDSPHEIVGVVTQPDRPKGRGHKMLPTPVKALALEHGIAVYQPEKVKNEALLPLLEELQPELIVVVAYGRILQPYILTFPKYGCINVHASLLPKYRGAAPIQWAVINGEEKTGVTTMQMDAGVDTGDILLSKETTVGTYETAGELFERLAQMGRELLLETIEGVANGTVSPRKQGQDYTLAPMLTKELAKIDWTKSAQEISKQICGMNPWPLAYTTYKGETLKITAATITQCPSGAKAGEILGLEKKKGLLVGCGNGALYLTEAQFAGSRKMAVEDYVRGHEVETGIILGEG
jgi:methionyl-tRNA formyltransferase